MRTNLAKNTLWSTLTYLIGSITGVAITPVLLSYLGTDGFGLYALSQAVVGYAGLLTFGVGRGVARMVADKAAVGDDREVSAVVSSALLLFLGLGAVISLIGIACAPLAARLFDIPAALYTDAVRLLQVTSVAYALNSFAGPLHGALVGLHITRASKRIELVQIVLGAVLSVAAAVSGRGLQGIALAVLAASIFSLLAVAVSVVRNTSLRPWPALYNKQDALALWRYGWRTQVVWIAGTVNRSIDRVWIGAFRSLGSVAAYDVADRASYSITFLANPLAGPLLPIITQQLATDDHDTVRRTYANATAVFASLAITLGIVASFFAEPILRVWLGTVPSGATVMMIVLALGYSVAVAASAADVVARSAAVPTVAAWAATFYAIGNVLLSLVGVLLWGAVGGASASGFSSACYAVVFSLYIEHRVLKARTSVVVPFALRVLAVSTPLALVFRALYGLLPSLPRLADACVVVGLCGVATMAVLAALAVLPVFPEDTRSAIRDFLTSAYARLKGSLHRKRPSTTA